VFYSFSIRGILGDPGTYLASAKQFKPCDPYKVILQETNDCWKHIFFHWRSGLTQYDGVAVIFDFCDSQYLLHAVVEI
jgi:hypothetical protein